MKAKGPERGRAGLGKDQPVQSVDINGDLKRSQILLGESNHDLPSDAVEVLANALTEALDALEGRLA